MPSARAKVTLDYELEIYSLLDGGSELNIMRRRVFERSNPAMDPEIHWRIDLYDSKTNETSMNVARCVCRDVSVDSGIEVKQHIFVVEHCNNDPILGRPWERLPRATFINEDDGPLQCRSGVWTTEKWHSSVQLGLSMK